MPLIDTAFVKEFDSSVRHLVQQGRSKLRGAVLNDSITGEEAFFEQLGPSTMEAVTDRHGDTVISDPDHQRRRVIPNPFDHAVLRDNVDKARILIDATGNYAMSLAMGAARKIDQIIIDQFDATATGGKDGSTNFSPLAGNEVPVNLSGASEGMTIDKLIRAQTVLLDHGLDTDMDEMHIAITSKQLDDLLQTSQITSVDFNSVKALVSGDIDTFMGFKFHIFGRTTDRVANLPLNVGTDVRSTFAWAKTGMMLAVASDVITRVDERPDKRHSIQVRTTLDMGATRLEEEKVAHILCDESPP